MKHYLLIAGENYYPSSGTGNWIDTFETEELAEKEVSIKEDFIINYKKERIPTKEIIIREKSYDWYEIIDLGKWIYR